MGIFYLLLFLLSCRAGVGAQLTLSPQTLTVLRGEEARFTCSTSNTQWTVMVWLLDNKAVLTISKEGGALPSIYPNVTAEESPDSRADSWALVLKKTERRNQGRVTCDLQGVDRKSALLFVQEKGSVKVFGDDKLAFKGQSVWFECQAAGWFPQPTLEWQVNDKKVRQDEYNISSEQSGPNLFTGISNLRVKAEKSSQVDCLASVPALATPLESGVRLTVVAEVLQEGDGCTVPLAVTASLSALLLLLLLSISAVCWHRQRRQAKLRAQEVTRFHLSGVGGGLVAEATRGRVNLAYASDVCTDAAYNELNTETGRKMDFVSFHKVPDVVASSSPSLHSKCEAQACPSEERSQNIRRITTV
ncbi:immunoglobulin superfamily member 5 [Brachionichthys hirsutus]|uniref:immunoglobulin superfamily member 5 n=1 Tax=Brachionichthys hirsutus TaxID=412623 RepID=UPI0036052E9F